MMLVERSVPSDCNKLATDATYIGSIHQVGGDGAADARLTLHRMDDGTFEARGSIAGLNASICGQDVALPEGSQAMRLRADPLETRLSGRVTGAQGAVWFELEAVPSDAQPCVEVFIEVDPEPFYCGTSHFEGTLCSPVSCVEEPPDSDGDEIPDPFDNCPSVSNPLQTDLDLDGAGDSCDPDRDGDTCSNEDDDQPDDGRVATGTVETCGQHGPVTLPVSEPASSDVDGDGLPSCRDPDDDNDGIPDAQDPCPASHSQRGAACHTQSELLRYCSIEPGLVHQGCIGLPCRESLLLEREKLVDPVDETRQSLRQLQLERIRTQSKNLGVH